MSEPQPIFPEFERAIAKIGLAEIARRLKDPPSLQQVANWRTRGVPVAEAAALEKACEGIFTRKHMFPKTYARIWPELARKREKVAA